MMDTDDDTIGPINLGNPEEFTMRELAEVILGLDRLALQNRAPAAAAR